MKDPGQLQLELVSFEKDRQQIFEAMVTRPVVVSALTKDRMQIQFSVDKIERSRVFLILENRPERPVTRAESVVLTFGLDEGQYFLKGTLEPVAGELYMVPIGEKLYRLQRRNNFRAPVPDSMQATFLLRNNAGGLAHEYRLADLSGGGLGLLVEKGRPLPFNAGDEVDGTLKIQDREPLHLEGVIRHIWPPDSEGITKVGIQCRHLSVEKEKELVAICMQIHREMFSIFRNFNR